MEVKNLLSKPVWQMTGEEFIFLNRHALQENEVRTVQPAADKDKKYVYGIGGDRKSTRLNSSHSV